MKFINFFKNVTKSCSRRKFQCLTIISIIFVFNIQIIGILQNNSHINKESFKLFKSNIFPAKKSKKLLSKASLANMKFSSVRDAYIAKQAFVKRAVAIYLPSQNDYFEEFKDQLYNSQRYTSLQQSNVHPSQQTVKTDLLIFTPRESLDNLPNDCKNEIVFKRRKIKNKFNSSNSTVESPKFWKEQMNDPNEEWDWSLPKIPDSSCDNIEKLLSQTSKPKKLSNIDFNRQFHDPLSRCYQIDQPMSDYKTDQKDYYFADSIVFLAIKKFSGFLNSYDLLMKTETDTFLTPKFRHWLPQTFQTGRGGYVNTKDTEKRLDKIAKQFDLNSKLDKQNKIVHNIGATLYGKPELLMASHRLALPIMKHIVFKEFLGSDRGEQPSQFYGVSSMYAIEIGVNLAINSFQVNGENLDFFPNHKDSIHKHAHIHAQHLDPSDTFSKQQYRMSRYKHFENKTLDINLIPDYCVAHSLNKLKPENVINTCSDFFSHQQNWLILE